MRQRRLLLRAGALALLGVAGLLGGFGCFQPEPGRKPAAEQIPAKDDPKRRGEDDARKAIAANKLVLKTWGLRRERGEIYDQVLKERLGVDSERVADCEVDSDLWEYARAYNRLMQEEIGRRFGQGALDQVAREADKREAARRKKWDP